MRKAITYVLKTLGGPFLWDGPYGTLVGVVPYDVRAGRVLRLEIGRHTTKDFFTSQRKVLSLNMRWEGGEHYSTRSEKKAPCCYNYFDGSETQLNRNSTRVGGVKHRQKHTVSPANAGRLMDQTLREDSRLPSPDRVGNRPNISKALETEGDAESSLKSVEGLRCARVVVSNEGLTGLNSHARNGGLNVCTSKCREVVQVSDASHEVRSVHLSCTIKLNTEVSVTEARANGCSSVEPQAWDHCPGDMRKAQKGDSRQDVEASHGEEDFFVDSGERESRLQDPVSCKCVLVMSRPSRWRSRGGLYRKFQQRYVWLQGERRKYRSTPAECDPIY